MNLFSSATFTAGKERNLCKKLIFSLKKFLKTSIFLFPRLHGQVSNISGSTGRVLPPLLGSACPAAPLHPRGGGEGQEDRLWSVGSLCPLPTVFGCHGSRWTVKRYIYISIQNYTLVCECRAFFMSGEAIITHVHQYDIKNKHRLDH